MTSNRAHTVFTMHARSCLIRLTVMTAKRMIKCFLRYSFFMTTLAEGKTVLRIRRKLNAALHQKYNANAAYKYTLVGILWMIRVMPPSAIRNDDRSRSESLALRWPMLFGDCVRDTPSATLPRYARLTISLFLPRSCLSCVTLGKQSRFRMLTYASI